MTDSIRSPALVFDLDGTLVDTAPDILNAANAVLVAEGRRTIALDTVRHMIGFGARSLIVQAMAATGAPATDEDLPRLVDSLVAHYREHIAEQSVPFPGVRETLAALKAEGARLAVLTNKAQDQADLLLPALNMTHYFEAIYGAGRMNVVKPDARVFHAVVEAMGGPGAGAVMIGDSKTDLATARAAGVPAILVSYGYTPEPANMLGADAVTGNFRDVPALVSAILRTLA